MLIAYAPSVLAPSEAMEFSEAMALIHPDAAVCWDRDLCDLEIVASPINHPINHPIRIYGCADDIGDAALALVFTGDSRFAAEFKANPYPHWIHYLSVLQC